MSSVPFSFAGITLAVAVCACASTTQTATPLSGSPHPRPSSSGTPQASGEADLAGASDRAVHAAVLERDVFVRAVLEKNPSLEAARHGIRAALARVHRTGIFEDPMVDVGVAPLSIGPSRAPFGFEIGVSQKLPWWGKRAFETQAMEAEAAAAKCDYETMKRELAQSAVMLYDDYFVAARSLEINGEHVTLMRAIHDSAIAQFGAGRGSAGDALMAEVELTHMEHDSVLLASQREVIAAQMNELLHRAPELPLPPPPKELPLPREPDGGTRDGTAEAIAQRPDIAAVEQRARAEEARAEQAERLSYPDITLSTSYSTMWEMPQHRWMVGVGLNVPFQTALRGGAGDEARAMRAQFQSEAARMTDAARTGAFVARRQLDETKHVLELFERRLLPVARQAIDAARAGFITSQNSINSVIESERNLRRLELEYQMRRAEYVRRRAELDRALGRIPGLDWKEERP